MKHPLSFIGLAILVGSWGLLLFGTGSDTHREIINFHKLFMALSGVISGVGFLLAGVILGGREPSVVNQETSEGSLPNKQIPAPEMSTEQRRRLAEELQRSISDAKAKL